MEITYLGKSNENFISSMGGGNVPSKDQFWKGSRGLWRWAIQHVVCFGKKLSTPWIYNRKSEAWRGWAMGNIEGLAMKPPGYNNSCRNWFGTWEAEICVTTALSLLLPTSWIKVQLKCLYLPSPDLWDQARQSIYLIKRRWSDALIICVSDFMGCFQYRGKIHKNMPLQEAEARLI